MILDILLIFFLVMLSFLLSYSLVDFYAFSFFVLISCCKPLTITVMSENPEIRYAC